MNRRCLPILFAVAVAGSLTVSLSSCNEPSCGAGTVQKQQSDGTLKCVPVDQQMAAIPCDVDAGMVTIVGGKCVPIVTCDPNSTMTSNGICYGTGGGGGVSCKTPKAGTSCISGTIYNFTTNAKSAVANLDVLLFNATDLPSANPTPLAVGQISADGSSYVFQDFVAPGLGLVVIATGNMTTGMVPTGTGGQGIGNNTVYQIDAYSLSQADVAGWGFDITAGGAYIARFFSDAASTSPTQNLNNDKTPVAGVTLLENGADPGAKYFNAGLTAIDPTLTSSGASGTAVVAAPIPEGGSFGQFTGMGGGIPTWETFPGGSKANFVLVTRFHPKP